MLEHINTGVVTEHVLTTNVYLSRKQYTAPKRRVFYTDVLARVSNLPGVQAAGAVDGLPPYRAITGPLTVGGTPAPGESADKVSFKHITPGYFEALRIPLLAGRVFAPRDLRAPAVAVANEALARRFFPDQDPVGRSVSSEFLNRPRTIIGIVGDVKNRGVQESALPELYILDEDGDVSVMVIRTTGDPQALASLVREQVRALDRNTPLTFRTMAEQMDREFTSQRFNSILLSSFAAIALFLAAIGIYGVMSYLVSQRRREIGIRMALGARTNQVLAQVIGHALRLVLAGIVVGLALAVGLNRYLKTLLYRVTATDALTLCSVAFLMGAVALFASYFPALRASRLDPSKTLRCE
jgi:putative ABC transport system permease protein